MTIEEKYQEKCNQPSDIYQLLPTLKEYASKCNVVIEMGVRACTSIYALLDSNAKTVYGYDIEKTPQVDECIQIAKECGKDFRFIEADVLKIKIPKCDMLFIDTFHSKLQLEQELKLHAGKVKKYLAFHDIVSYWEVAEHYEYEHAKKNKVDGKEGLKYAIEPFMAEHPEWKQVVRHEFNNGLLILEKVI